MTNHLCYKCVILSSFERIYQVMTRKIKVLFICHGNICRSPMAEFILKDMVQKRGMAGQFVIASAATSTEEIWGEVGNPVYPPAREELAKHGISCEGKHAVQLRRSDYDKYDYLIGMDDRNLRNMQRMTGGKLLEEGGKLALLLSFAGEQRSIADPWYSHRFDVTYQDIVTGCEAFLQYLSNQ
jgi:protein-tyrosine phosphatase